MLEDDRGCVRGEEMVDLERQSVLQCNSIVYSPSVPSPGDNQNYA